MQIRVASVRPSVVDEWFGVEVRFDWVIPPEKRWTDDIDLAHQVAAQIVKSPEYAAFYSKPTRVTCEEYEDGPPRQVTLPRFQAEDFVDWNFSSTGGWMTASDR